ncbi:MAG: hypothetical protein ACP5H2_03565 [Solirubrobacteraceae bacterium]
MSTLRAGFQRRPWAAVLALIGAGAVGLGFWQHVQAAQAAGTVTIQTAYENNPISVGMTDTVGYEVSNSTGVTQTVSFTDNLPAGVVLDSVPAVTDLAGAGSCTIQNSITNPDAPAVYFQLSVSPGSFSPVCTISVAVVANTASIADAPLYDSYSSVSQGATGAAAGLVVLTAPALSVQAPVSGQSFALGGLVDANFTCSATDPLDSIDAYFATDDEGNQIESGDPIDTVDPGPHTLQFACYSAVGGGYVAQTVSYTVGSYKLRAVRVLKSGEVTFRTSLPAGTLLTKLLYKTKLVGEAQTVLKGASKPVISVKLSAAGRKLLAGVRAPSVALKLQTAFTPAPLGSGVNAISPVARILLARPVRLSMLAIKRSRAGVTGRRAQRAAGL